MDRNSQINPANMTIYNLDSLAISQRSSSPIPAPLDLSCHNRHGSAKTTDYNQETAYNYSSAGIPESNYSHGIQETVIPTPQQLQYSQYPYDSAHHGLYPYDQEFAYRVSTTCSPPPTSTDLYTHHEYHQYRVKSPVSPNLYEANQYRVKSPTSPNPYEADQYRLKSPTSPNPYEANSVMYSPSHYRLPQLPYSPTHDNIHEKSWPSSEGFDSEYSTSGMTYQPLTVSTSHMTHTGHEIFVSPQGHYEPVSPRGLVSPTGSQHSSYGAYGGQLSPPPMGHDIVSASGCDSRHSSSDSSVSTEPSSTTTIPEGLTRYPKGKARRPKIYHKNLSEDEIIQRKREINNDSSRRHRQRKSLSMKQLEEEEQKEMVRQVHLTKTRDMLKQQTELLGSLIKKVDLNRK